MGNKHSKKVTEKKVWLPYQPSFIRKVDREAIPTCPILGVQIADVEIHWVRDYLGDNKEKLRGDYITVANVHTTVTAYRDPEYLRIQNGGVMAIPDGAPLSKTAHHRGYKEMQRCTGPTLMRKMFEVSVEKGYRHYFYGATEETLNKLKANLERDYPGIQIVGMYAPPFRKENENEDESDIERINATHPDFVWIGLGAPKQEKWAANHQGKIDACMIGVGAGFDYFAGNIKRAPKWMRKCCLEWFYRLLQNPKLFGRYFKTNTNYIWNAEIRRK